MSLKLYNTLTKTKEVFIPNEQGKVRFYVCGPTIYDYIHLGNARAFIVFDVFRRFLLYSGFEVKYVMNLTDIDDRIINKANQEKTSCEAVTEKFSKAFFEDLDALHVLPANAHPKATEHIDDIVVFIQRLIEGGVAYEAGGDVFYDVSKFPEYGKLSGKRTEELISGSRIAVDEKKKNPLDFALWKKHKEGEPFWESPWGRGRPGWHIECSAMSMKLLGDGFDIHGGGIDLIFPHHENEIAQSEAVTDRKFVKYWMHNGFLNIDGEKMAKSLGNFRTAREVLKHYSGEVIRLFFLQKHYRSPIDFTNDGLLAARSGVTRLSTFYKNLAQKAGNDREDFDLNSLTASEKTAYETWKKLKFELDSALNDDFNTPVAISKLFEMVRAMNKLVSKDELTDNEKLIASMAKADFERLNSIFDITEKEKKGQDSELLDDVMNLLIGVREELRKKKEWQLADRIRDELKVSGIILEDSSSGTSWHLK